MDAIEFIREYKTYLAEIEQVVKPEYQVIIDRMKNLDPHDFIKPSSWFQGAVNARGYVWTLFLNEKSKMIG